jgi:2-polyprenyl-6-methoxyphenol hydroxylase-like FAD-dependent oxidoreductase
MKPQTEVLIIGAGPTGLVLALWLHKQGIKIRIIDQAESPAKNSRALVVHARIIEMYRQLDLADNLLEIGYKLPATNLWVHKQHKARIPLGEFGVELTPYPFMLTVPQDEHERMLEKRLNDLGVRVERRMKLQGFVDHGSSITATLFREVDGISETCDASFIVGCDGAHSAVRHAIGAKYEGETYKPLFYIADIESRDEALANGEGNLMISNDTFNLIVPYNKEGHVRLVGITIPDNNDTHHHESTEEEHKITFDDVRPQIKEAMDMEIDKVNWFSTYRSHHRVADKFRSNRAFLVGDAAHIHSPVGGQGMNTGIMDAINLAWKLATVLKMDMEDEAKHQLLESYESERRAFALKIVTSTDAGFTTLTSKGIFPHILRNWLIPYLVPLAVKFEHARTQIFRGGSQLICSYRGSSLSQKGAAGVVQPGDRLPWVRMDPGDNFSMLRDIGWQVHVYGETRPLVDEWAQRMSIKTFGFQWDEEYAKSGLTKDVVYLLRPDHYIAGIFEGPTIVSGLNGYFSVRGLGC